jgi:hypothetical protein
MGRGLGSSERSGRDEPIWVVIHKCMEQHKESPRIAIFISN